jgi:hypothetical protein
MASFFRFSFATFASCNWRWSCILFSLSSFSSLISSVLFLPLNVHVWLCDVLDSAARCLGDALCIVDRSYEGAGVIVRCRCGITLGKVSFRRGVALGAIVPLCCGDVLATVDRRCWDSLGEAILAGLALMNLNFLGGDSIISPELNEALSSKISWLELVSENSLLLDSSIWEEASTKLLLGARWRKRKGRIISFSSKATKLLSSDEAFWAEVSCLLEDLVYLSLLDASFREEESSNVLLVKGWRKRKRILISFPGDNAAKLPLSEEVFRADAACFSCGGERQMQRNLLPIWFCAFFFSNSP